ncbi:MAG TPA: hypothetical protein VI299_10635 [Polyangiales bacterium]
MGSSRGWPLSFAALGACGLTMAQPIDVIQISDELPIADRSSFSGALANESFKLGSYQVTDVDRKWDRTDGVSLFGSDTTKTKGGYAYKLNSGEGTLKGECATEDSSAGQQLGGGVEYRKSAVRIGCRCNDSSGAITLTVGGGDDAAFQGEVSASFLHYRVLAITQREKGPSSHEPLGYRIDGESSPIGAVDLKRPGKVWISKAVDGHLRQEIACLFAGLLLYLPKQQL